MSIENHAAESPLLTVIVAVYKTEEFFERCLNSLFASEYKNLEILLIDDGSPDNCPALCEEYAKKDARIKVVHKENGGGHSAKNLGISIATGKYIAICDNDDMVPADGYRIMMERAIETDADVIRGIVRRTMADTGDVRLFHRSDADLLMTKLIGFQGAIYKTSMLQEKQIRLGAYRLGDDMCFMAQVMNYAKQIEYVDAVTYEYIIRPSNSKEASAVQSKTKNFPHYYDEFRWRSWVLSYVTEHERLKNAYGTELGVFCMAITEDWLSYTQEEREKCFKELRVIVDCIDWAHDKENAKGYLQVDIERFKSMNEAEYTKYLQREFQVIRPAKNFVKKLIGRK